MMAERQQPCDDCDASKSAVGGRREAGSGLKGEGEEWGREQVKEGMDQGREGDSISRSCAINILSSFMASICFQIQLLAQIQWTRLGNGDFSLGKGTKISLFRGKLQNCPSPINAALAPMTQLHQQECFDMIGL